MQSTKRGNTMLETEFKFYQDNKADFLRKYNNRYVVIKDRKVLGDFASREEAIETTQKDHALGTFLIQHVSADDEEIQRFHSRVSFDESDSPASSLHD